MSRIFAILSGAGVDPDLNIFKQTGYFRIFIQDFPFAIAVVQKCLEFANCWVWFGFLSRTQNRIFSDLCALRLRRRIEYRPINFRAWSDPEILETAHHWLILHGSSNTRIINHKALKIRRETNRFGGNISPNRQEAPFSTCQRITQHTARRVWHQSSKASGYCSTNAKANFAIIKRARTGLDEQVSSEIGIAVGIGAYDDVTTQPRKLELLYIYAGRKLQQRMEICFATFTIITFLYTLKVIFQSQRSFKYRLTLRVTGKR